MASLKSFDLVVIGAGIYGCWSALHASARGLKVALVDRGDIAGATSSCSTKLLHGGLRYLEQYEFSIVRKSLAERKELKAIFPHLFKPASFWIPVKDGRPAHPKKLGLGLWVYEHLARSKGVVPPSRKQNIEDLRSSFSSMDFGEVQGAYSYGDGITDDHRMALAVALSAIDHGCKVFTYHEASILEDHLISLQPEEGISFQLETQKVLHCTGSDLKGYPLLRDQLRLTQGTHLVLPDLGQEDALLLTSPIDERKFFLVPWYGRTLLGTTDLSLGPEEKPVVRKDEVSYLLNSLQACTGLHFTEEDILGSFVGVRVLQGGEGLKPSEVSRGWACRKIDSNQWASLGGKYTSARIDALEMVDEIFPGIPQKNLKIRDFDGKPPQHHLHGRYGASSQKIDEMIKKDPSLGELIFPDLEFIWAEVLHSLQSEKVTHLVDLMRRRLPLTLLHPWDENVAIRAATLAENELKWSEDQKARELADLEAYWKKSLTFSG